MFENMIDKNILIEDLVDNYPFSVKYLSENGIRCIVCGEAIWGTLDEACKEKNFDDSVIDSFVSDLNKQKADFEREIKRDLKKINDDKMNG